MTDEIKYDVTFNNLVHKKPCLSVYDTESGSWSILYQPERNNFALIDHPAVRKGNDKIYQTDSMSLLKLYLLDAVEGITYQKVDWMLDEFYTAIKVNHPDFESKLGIEVV